MIDLSKTSLQTIWHKRTLFFCAFVLCATSLWAQETPTDSTNQIKTDTIQVLPSDSIIRRGKKISVQAYTARFNPRKALLYSAILPGAGQVYNRKYWKVPLVYGGIIGLGLVVDFYNQTGNKYRNELFTLLNTGASPSGRDETTLRNIVDQARRQRDYFMIFTGFFYILQLIDAHVDAHLKEFDVNPRLKASIEPAMQNSYLTGSTVGMSIVLKF